MIRTIFFMFIYALSGTALCENSDYELKYFDEKKLDRLEIWDLVSKICDVRLGMVSRTTELECNNNGCEGKIIYGNSLYKEDVLLDSKFNLLFSKEHEFDNKERIEKTVTSGENDKKVEIEVLLENSGISKKEAIDIKSCVKQLGDVLVEKILGSERKELLSNELEMKQDSSNRKVIFQTLENMEYAILKISHPSDIEINKIETVEVTVIPSLRLGTNIDEDTLSKLSKEEISKMRNIDLKGNIVPGHEIAFEAKYVSEDWVSGEVVAKENHFTSATISIKGGASKVENITPMKQALNPLTPTRWVWQIKFSDEYEGNLYLSVKSVNTVIGGEYNDLINIPLHVKVDGFQSFTKFIENNWQWFAGSILIPLLIYSWKRKGEVEKS